MSGGLILDVLCGRPWAINKTLPVGIDIDESDLMRDQATRLGQSILEHRTPVVFVDEIQSITEGLDWDDAVLKMFGLVCPWKSCWMEWQIEDGVRFGAHVTTTSLEQAASILENEARFIELTDHIDGNEDRVISMSFFAGNSRAKSASGPLCVLVVVIGDDYKVMTKDGQTMTWMLPTSTLSPKEIRGITSCGGIVVLQTICFANASNIEIVEDGKTNDDVGRKRREKNRLPWVSYNVLKIKRGTQYISLKPKTQDGSGTALHKVRGHFARYGVEGRKPMFGKRVPNSKSGMPGYVWVPEHLRGTPDLGVRVHDYEMEEV